MIAGKTGADLWERDSPIEALGRTGFGQISVGARGTGRRHGGKRLPGALEIIRVFNSIGTAGDTRPRDHRMICLVQSRGEARERTGVVRIRAEHCFPTVWNTVAIAVRAGAGEPGGTAGLPAGAPVQAVVVVAIGIDYFERRSQPVGRGRPGSQIVIGKIVNRIA